MPKLIDLTGRQLGRWRVISLYSKRRRPGQRTTDIFWLCRCDCDGIEKIVNGSSLRRGHSLSCGCLAREQLGARMLKHGHRKNGQASRAYTAWRSMMQRCYDPNHKSYGDYGARGIGVVPRWHTFTAFYADVGDPPDDKSLDRIDVNGDYGPSNFKWATASEQRRNQRPHKRGLGNVRIYSSRTIKREARRAKFAERQKFAAALARAKKATTSIAENGTDAPTLARPPSREQGQTPA
jgi:hypothetical protein